MLGNIQPATSEALKHVYFMYVPASGNNPAVDYA